MDVSRMSCSKSASSDFSIERILSDDSKERKREEDLPSWLCCTRYKPPRIPRVSQSNNSCRVRRSGRHARVPFTATQAAALEAAYTRAPYLAPPALRALAAALQLRDDRIKIWFQNRRARERREKSVVTPPQAVTLPATTSSRFIPPPSQWIPFTTNNSIYINTPEPNSLINKAGISFSNVSEANSFYKKNNNDVSVSLEDSRGSAIPSSSDFAKNRRYENTINQSDETPIDCTSANSNSMSGQDSDEDVNIDIETVD